LRQSEDYFLGEEKSNVEAIFYYFFGFNFYGQWSETQVLAFIAQRIWSPAVRFLQNSASAIVGRSYGAFAGDCVICKEEYSLYTRLFNPVWGQQLVALLFQLKAIRKHRP